MAQERESPKKQAMNSSNSKKFGARVTLLDGHRVQIYQTELNKSGRYVLRGNQTGVWKDITDVGGIGQAVLDALAGKLP